MLLIINSDPVQEVHICWYTRRDYSDSSKIVLMEVVNVKYAHPEAPEAAWVWVVEERSNEPVRAVSLEAASLILMEANQRVIDRERKTND